jgi:uncharacterized protein YjbI with pentapeptide repeats
MADISFTPTSLPVAISGLFSLNGYVVTGPIIKDGGEIDLIATKPSDLFPEPIYIEATIEHVDNEKYAKDLTKLAPIRQSEPGSKAMIVSATGFTAAVRTKAAAAGIVALTYQELEQRFQRFEPLIQHVFGDSAAAKDLRDLVAVYEEPNFDDQAGSERATQWLADWLNNPIEHPWLIVTGEYGTGKTALTQVLLHRWLSEYRADSTRPIPFRIELRSFTRQFDARGLLHQFLDSHGLAALPIEFVLSLIRSGRVVLLLDGYDEMAQYMSARERRACLEALAQLSAEGARGLLTSRPNYFTEAEELQVLEALYVDLSQRDKLIADETAVIVEEAEIDSLFENQILNRLERHLRDLTPTQTEELIARKLADDVEARTVVLGLLRRIFRSTTEGTDLALSGKPVIITYLLDIADDLKTESFGEAPINEWQIYDLIVRRLMIRDFRAAPEMPPERRRAFLRRLAVRLSRRDSTVLTDKEFLAFVSEDFDAELKKVPPETRESRLQQLTTDLRRSATLTRNVIGDGSGFRFSHNSLREFLAAESILEQLDSERTRRYDLPISDAMRNFVASQGAERIAAHASRLAVLWAARSEDDGAGQILSLLWTALVSLHAQSADIVRTAMSSVAGTSLDMGRVALDGLDFTSLGQSSLPNASFQDSSCTRVSFAGVNLRGSSFIGAVLDEVDFTAANLTDATFDRAVLLDVNFTDATVKGADFRNVDDTFEVRSGVDRFAGPAAAGLLRANGALTRDVDPIHVLRHHPKFDVAFKVARILLDGSKHQVRGLTQRGSARSDPRFAARFLTLLINSGMISVDERQLVQVTDAGRRQLGPIVELRHATPEFEALWRTAVSRGTVRTERPRGGRQP